VPRDRHNPSTGLAEAVDGGNSVLNCPVSIDPAAEEISDWLGCPVENVRHRQDFRRKPSQVFPEVPFQRTSPNSCLPPAAFLAIRFSSNACVSQIGEDVFSPTIRRADFPSPAFRVAHLCCKPGKPAFVSAG